MGGTSRELFRCACTRKSNHNILRLSESARAGQQRRRTDATRHSVQSVHFPPGSQRNDQTCAYQSPRAHCHRGEQLLQSSHPTYYVPSQGRITSAHGTFISVETTRPTSNFSKSLEKFEGGAGGFVFIFHNFYLSILY